MIILSPIGLLMRDATDTSRSWSRMSATYRSELELVLHLVEHVAECFGRRSQQLDDVLARLEDRAERHRDDRMLAHDRFVDALVREDVFPRRVEHFERSVGDDR